MGNQTPDELQCPMCERVFKAGRNTTGWENAAILVDAMKVHWERNCPGKSNQ